MNLYEATYTSPDAAMRSVLFRAEDVGRAADLAGQHLHCGGHCGVLLIRENAEQHLFDGTPFTVEEIDKIGQISGEEQSHALQDATAAFDFQAGEHLGKRYLADHQRA